MTAVSITHEKPFRRRDPTRHLEPHYAAHLRARSRWDSPPADAPAFIDGPLSHDDAAELFGAGFVTAATSGDDLLGWSFDAATDEERGGPYVVTTGDVELAVDADAPRPNASEPEPSPASWAIVMRQGTSSTTRGCAAVDASGAPSASTRRRRWCRAFARIAQIAPRRARALRLIAAAIASHEANGVDVRPSQVAMTTIENAQCRLSGLFPSSRRRERRSDFS